jgi:hypothetical protein
VSSHVPGQWPANCGRPTTTGPWRAERALGRAPLAPAATVVPIVTAEVTIDLSPSDIYDRHQLDEALQQQTRHSFEGAAVRVILGRQALSDTSLPRRLAGHTLGTVSITVVGAPDTLPHRIRMFAAELHTECRSVLADHLAMLAELRS